MFHPPCPHESVVILCCLKVSEECPVHHAEGFAGAAALAGRGQQLLREGIILVERQFQL